MLPARFELAAFGFLFLEQSYSMRYETDVITDYTKEAVGHLMVKMNQIPYMYPTNDLECLVCPVFISVLARTSTYAVGTQVDLS